jgi:hypothetical protein
VLSNTAWTKAEGQGKGCQIAMKARVEHQIHRKEGTIGQRYRNDPRRSNGLSQPRGRGARDPFPP